MIITKWIENDNSRDFWQKGYFFLFVFVISFKSKWWYTCLINNEPYILVVILAQFSLYVHKVALNPIHFISNSSDLIG